MNNVELLRQVIERVSSTEADLNIQTQLQAARNRLQQMIQQPQQPELQTQLTSDLERLAATVNEFCGKFSRPEIDLMYDMNGRIIFLEDLPERLEFLSVLSQHKPDTLLEYVASIIAQRQERLSSLEELGRVLAETGRRRWFEWWKGRRRDSRRSN